MNYFGDGIDAGRYARVRPYVHPTALAKFQSLVRIDIPIALALDVGCGTGQSTVVLTEIAKRVMGIDPSVDMLCHATPHSNVAYQQASAENIPFRDGQFDLITVAQAFHWFDQGAFLTEAHRLLKVQGWLVVYTSWFTGVMDGEPAFSDWWKGEYLRRFPTPPRNRTPITDDLALKYGFTFHGEHEFFDAVDMTLERFTDFQLSTSNVIAAVDGRQGSYEDAGQWISDSLECFFTAEGERVFLFSGKIWILEKTVCAC